MQSFTLLFRCYISKVRSDFTAHEMCLSLTDIDLSPVGNHGDIKAVGEAHQNILAYSPEPHAAHKF